MGINIGTHLGQVQISKQAIATLAGTSATECYGVVGISSSKSSAEEFLKLLNKKSYSNGIVIRETGDKIELDLYLILAEGIKIAEIVTEVQKRVQYAIESTFNIEVVNVNINIQGIRVEK